jgi:hypothetical protein
MYGYNIGLKYRLNGLLSSKKNLLDVYNCSGPLNIYAAPDKSSDAVYPPVIKYKLFGTEATPFTPVGIGNLFTPYGILELAGAK